MLVMTTYVQQTVQRFTYANLNIILKIGWQISSLQYILYRCLLHEALMCSRFAHLLSDVVFFWREFSCKHQRDALDILQQCVLFSSSSTFDNSLVRMTREHIFAIRAMHIHTVTLGDGFSLLFSIPFPSRDVKRFRHFIVHTHKNTTMEKSTHTRTERVK